MRRQSSAGGQGSRNSNSLLMGKDFLVEGAGREHAGAPSSRDSGSPLLPREGVGGGGGADMQSKERVDGFDLAAGGRLPGIGAHAVLGGARPGAKKHKKMVMAISQAELDARTARAPSPLAEDVAEYVPTTEMKSQVCVCVCVLPVFCLSVCRSVGLSVCLSVYVHRLHAHENGCIRWTRCFGWEGRRRQRSGQRRASGSGAVNASWETVCVCVCVYVCVDR